METETNRLKSDNKLYYAQPNTKPVERTRSQAARDSKSVRFICVYAPSEVSTTIIIIIIIIT